MLFVFVLRFQNLRTIRITESFEVNEFRSFFFCFGLGGANGNVAASFFGIHQKKIHFDFVLRRTKKSRNIHSSRLDWPMVRVQVAG